MRAHYTGSSVSPFYVTLHNTHYRQSSTGKNQEDPENFALVVGVLIEIRTGKQEINCKKARNGTGFRDAGVVSAE
jgi:hypothetical protein